MGSDLHKKKFKKRSKDYFPCTVYYFLQFIKILFTDKGHFSFTYGICVFCWKGCGSQNINQALDVGEKLMRSYQRERMGATWWKQTPSEFWDWWTLIFPIKRKDANKIPEQDYRTLHLLWVIILFTKYFEKKHLSLMSTETKFVSVLRTRNWLIREVLKREIHAPFFSDVLVSSLGIGPESLDLNPYPLVYKACDFMKVTYLSRPPFPQLQNTKNLSTKFIRLSWGLT